MPNTNFSRRFGAFSLRAKSADGCRPIGPGSRLELSTLPRWAALASAMAVLAGCEDGSLGTLNGTSMADSISGDLSLAAADVSAEATATTDASAPAADLGQTEPADSADAEQPAEVISDATARVEVSAEVSAEVTAEVTATPDVKTEVADTAADPCTAKSAQFNKLLTDASVCADFWQCYKPATASANCPDCQLHFNGTAAVTQNLIDFTPEWKKSGCAKTCSTPCVDMVSHVGVCSAGACQSKLLTCKELDSAAGQALAVGAKCSADTDCTFKVSNTLGCGCPTFVNVKAMGPGKPLFLYMTMLVKAYKAKVCTKDVVCECPDPQTAKCVAGICIAQ